MMKYTRGKHPNSRNGFKKGYISSNKGQHGLYKHSEESKKKMSTSKKGSIPWNKNKKGLQVAWNKGLRGLKIGWIKGKKRTKEDNEKKRLRQIGRKQSKRTIEKRKNTYKKIKLNQKEKNGMWNGGSSFEPYSLDWTETLRKSIRQRDNFKCKLCNKTQKQNSRKLDVHHIDYNKKNCNPNNLISLCRICHNKTKINRKEWIKYFSNYIIYLK